MRRHVGSENIFLKNEVMLFGMFYLGTVEKVSANFETNLLEQMRVSIPVHVETECFC